MSAEDIQASQLLHMWAASYSMRNYVILRAHAAGIPVTEISRITGLARTTINRIVKGAE